MKVDWKWALVGAVLASSSALAQESNFGPKDAKETYY
jgi:hypothetical protein